MFFFPSLHIAKDRIYKNIVQEDFETLDKWLCEHLYGSLSFFFTCGAWFLNRFVHQSCHTPLFKVILHFLLFLTQGSYEYLLMIPHSFTKCCSPEKNPWMQWYFRGESLIHLRHGNRPGEALTQRLDIEYLRNKFRKPFVKWGISEF